MVEIAWGGETWSMLPERAVYWHERRALLVADPHFGKADHFRASGIPTPNVLHATLRRLDAALAATAAKELVFLGDFFHARGGVVPEMIDALRDWRESHAALTIGVLAGNHDRHAGPPPDTLGMARLGIRIDHGGLTLCHHPEPQPGRFVVAGHLHPGVRLRSAIGQGLRMPCFHLTRDVLILPAFGDFTGVHVIRPRVGDRVFAVGPGAVVEVTPAFPPRPG